MGGAGSFRLGDWRVEPAANLLTRGDEAVRLELKLMQVLTCLADHAGEVVSKRGLIDEVWRTEFIAENTLTRAIAGLRRALGDDARHPSFIETIPKRGYRLVTEVVADRPVPAVPLADTAEPERPVFVAREEELDRLDRLLRRALESRGSVAWVAGEAGTGKTALVGELCRRALEETSGVVVTWGACNAATGAGDPYGPWRQILAQLTGDAEAAAGAGVLGPKQAARLWSLAPDAGRAVAELGLDLIDTLVPGRALVQRMEGLVAPSMPWLEALRRQVELRSAVPAVADIRQSALFEQAARVVRRLAEGRPLLLVVEDLHWIDPGSAGLLFHLGRRLDGCRALVVGTYRVSEIALGRNGGRHPVEPVLHELKREHGDTEITLDASGDRAFVDALVDSEPNRLDGSFRDQLFRRTGGHALFTVELLRTMQERGELVRDDDGCWFVATGLDWGVLPARVEGVLSERIGRLPEELRELLTVAAVEGEEFTAEVVARVRGVAAGDLVATLGRDLEHRHRLIEACGVRQLNGGRLSRYRFGHALFADHLYSSLDDAGRAYLHDDVGSAIEALYGAQVDRIAAELAHHYERAGRFVKAVEYLRTAAVQATAVSAFVEAEGCSRRALELLAALPKSDTREAGVAELLQIRGSSLAASRGWGDPELREVSDELRRHYADVGDAAGRCWAIFQLISHHGSKGELDALPPLLGEILEVAESSGKPGLIMTAHWNHLYMIWQGKPARALEHLEAAIALLDDRVALDFFRLNGFDPRPVLPMWTGVALLFLGHSDRAAFKMTEAVRVADDLGNPFSRAFVRSIVGPALAYAGAEVGIALCREGIAIANERGFVEVAFWARLGEVFAAAVRGEGEPNERYIDEMRATGYLLPLPWCLRLRCALMVASGCAEEALAEIGRTREVMDSSAAHIFKSQIGRLEGDALRLLGDDDGAERAYLHAIDVARGQRTRPFELEAATSLARLWHGQGRNGDARVLLQPVVEWFTEGLEWPALVEARALLNELSA